MRFLLLIFIIPSFLLACGETKNETIIKEKIVEVVKEIPVEKEIIREVEIEKIIVQEKEVIKEVPVVERELIEVEVIKTVEVFKDFNSSLTINLSKGLLPVLLPVVTSKEPFAANTPSPLEIDSSKRSS